MGQMHRSFRNSHISVDKASRHIAFLLLPGFSHYSFSAALEPLRSANIITGRQHFTWTLVGTTDRQVTASNGVTTLVDFTLDELDTPDEVVLFAATNADPVTTAPAEKWLRFHYRQGGNIRAVSSGVMVLARTGLLDNQRCAAHWEDTPRLRETFPRVTVTDSIFEPGDRISTCAGGAASAHMMLAMLEHSLGPALALDVATRMVIDRIRDGRDSLDVLPHIRYGTSNRLLLQAIALMNDNISEPLRIREMAAKVGASVRALERQFKSELGATPDRFYRRIRLSRARQLLRYSDHSLVEVAAYCGFGNTQLLKKHYETVYGTSPRAERQRSRSAHGPAPILHEVNADY